MQGIKQVIAMGWHVASFHLIGCKLLFLIPLTSAQGFKLLKTETDLQTSNRFFYDLGEKKTTAWYMLF